MIIHKVNQHNDFMIRKKLLKNWLMENLYMNNMGWKKFNNHWNMAQNLLLCGKIITINAFKCGEYSFFCIFWLASSPIVVHITSMGLLDSILIHVTSFCKGDVLSVVQIRFIYLMWNKFLNKVKIWKCMESKGRIITMNPKLHSYFDNWMSQGWISNVTRMNI
jgi:hypothetical protein